MMTTDKAGVIPFYIREDGEIMMLFRTPSDPNFGGNKPQVGKGCVDDGETFLQAAIREGEEELGLVRSNIVGVTALPARRIKGAKTEYLLRMYAVEILDPSNFTSPDYETAEVMWMTADEFDRVGRNNQKLLVQLAVSAITGKQH